MYEWLFHAFGIGLAGGVMVRIECRAKLVYKRERVGDVRREGRMCEVETAIVRCISISIY